MHAETGTRVGTWNCGHHRETARSVTMSGKTIVAVMAAILLASTTLASAQTPAAPRHWGGGYYGPGTPDYPPGRFGGGPGYYGPGYYDYAPGYYGYAPGPYNNTGPYYNLWNDWTNDHGWNGWSDWND
jgi:hypothetical protein